MKQNTFIGTENSSGLFRTKVGQYQRKGIFKAPWHCPKRREQIHIHTILLQNKPFLFSDSIDYIYSTEATGDFSVKELSVADSLNILFNILITKNN
ncbi:MAG: hypothetical protein V1915_02575 [Candidatus Bathyarchaeota archaeon]